MFKCINVLSGITLVLLLSLQSKEVIAVEVLSLYQGKVIVKDQSSVERRKGLKEAFSVVLVKVGGTKNILSNQALQSAMQNYNLYLAQYQYKTIDNELFLKAQFNEDKVNQLFQKEKLSLWGSLRPQLLLWLIEEDMLVRDIVSSSSSSILPSLVNNFSQTRGLPVAMPLMDLEDTQNISLSDLWGRFERPINEASERYSAEAVVVVRLSNSSLLSTEQFSHNKDGPVTIDCGLLCRQDEHKTYYALDWSYLNGEAFVSKQYTGLNKESLLKEALDDITEVTYEKYALSTTEAQSFTLEVANVDSLTTYMGIFDFLSTLSNVQSVTLIEATGVRRIFSLNILGSDTALLKTLKLNDELQQYIDPFATGSLSGDNIHPVFYWKSNE